MRQCDWCGRYITGSYWESGMTSGVFCSQKCVNEYEKLRGVDRASIEAKNREAEEKRKQESMREGGRNCTTCSHFSACWATDGNGTVKQPYFSGLPAYGECSVESGFINYDYDDRGTRSIAREIQNAEKYRRQRQEWEDENRFVASGKGWPPSSVFKDTIGRLGCSQLKQPPGTAASYTTEDHLQIQLTGGDSNFVEIFLWGTYPRNSAIRNLKEQIEAMSGKEMSTGTNATLLRYHYYHSLEVSIDVTGGSIKILIERDDEQIPTTTLHAYYFEHEDEADLDEDDFSDFDDDDYEDDDGEESADNDDELLNEDEADEDEEFEEFQDDDTETAAPAPAQSAAVCVSCGAALKAGSKFCSKCGAKQAAAACASCGAALKSGAKFCSKCGTKTAT